MTTVCCDIDKLPVSLDVDNYSYNSADDLKHVSLIWIHLPCFRALFSRVVCPKTGSHFWATRVRGVRAHHFRLHLPGGDQSMGKCLQMAQCGLWLV